MAQYGRYNNNAVDLYEEGPFASSDHDPIIVGLDAGYEEAPAPIDFRDVRSDHPHYDAIPRTASPSPRPCTSWRAVPRWRSPRARRSRT